MKQLPKREEIQERIDEVQDVYHQWCLLLPELEKINQLWEKGQELMDKLEKFYFDGEFSQYFELIENGEVEIDLKTKNGEYSIMSEDAIWIAFSEQQDLAWRMMHLAMKTLDKQNK